MFHMFRSSVSIVIYMIRHVWLGCLMMHVMHDLQCLNAGITPGCYTLSGWPSHDGVLSKFSPVIWFQPLYLALMFDSIYIGHVRLNYFSSTFQRTNNIFLSQQISQQYFQPWLISQHGPDYMNETRNNIVCNCQSGLVPFCDVEIYDSPSTSWCYTVCTIWNIVTVLW